MNNEKRTICIIPARGGSKGIPGKNLIDFCGRPLLQWSIFQARESGAIDEVYVSSDDRKILETAVAAGASPVERPASLAVDTASSEEALLHALDRAEEEKEKADTVVFLQATSPVREAGDIRAALKFFQEQKADSLFSAAVLDDICLWKKKEEALESLTFDYRKRGRRQDRNPYYLENGSIYIFKSDSLRTCKNRLGGKIVVFPMPLWKSFEIDSPADIDLCAHYMRRIINGEQNIDS